MRNITSITFCYGPYKSVQTTLPITYISIISYPASALSIPGIRLGSLCPRIRRRCFVLVRWISRRSPRPVRCITHARLWWCLRAPRTHILSLIRSRRITAGIWSRRRGRRRSSCRSRCRSRSRTGRRSRRTRRRRGFHDLSGGMLVAWPQTVDVGATLNKDGDNWDTVVEYRGVEGGAMGW